MVEVLERIFIFESKVIELRCVEWNRFSIYLALGELGVFMFELAILLQLSIKHTTLFDGNALPYLARPEFAK